MAARKNFPLKKRPINVVCDYVVNEPEQDEPVDLCIKRVKYDEDVKPTLPLKAININKIRNEQHNDSAFSFENAECEKYLQSKYSGNKSPSSSSPQPLYDMLPAYHYDRYYHENAIHIKQEYTPSNPSREYTTLPDYSLPKTPFEFYSKHHSVKEERYTQPNSRYMPYALKHNSSMHEQYHMASSPNSLNSIGSPRSSVSPLSTSSINDEFYHHMTKSSAASYDITAVPPQYCEDKSETPRYQCTECGKSYSTYSGLTKHTQFHCPAIEGNQAKKTYDCEYCDKVYTSSGALKMHIRTHTLPCKCEICGKAFSRPWLLQGHIRTHTGEKPFSCQHCHRAFADRSNLRAHLQTHSDVKKYSCTTCVKTFSRMSLLTKHTESGCAGLHRSLSPHQYL